MEFIACFEFGDTSHYMEDYPSYLAKIEKYKENRKGSKKVDNGDKKGNKGEKTVRIKAKVKIPARV